MFAVTTAVFVFVFYFTSRLDAVGVWHPALVFIFIRVQMLTIKDDGSTNCGLIYIVATSSFCNAISEDGTRNSQQIVLKCQINQKLSAASSPLTER